MKNNLKIIAFKKVWENAFNTDLTGFEFAELRVRTVKKQSPKAFMIDVTCSLMVAAIFIVVIAGMLIVEVLI